jgi:hypothetical protein
LLITIALAPCESAIVQTPIKETPGNNILPTSGEPDIIISPPAGQKPEGNDIIINALPEEYLIFQGYLEAINASPSLAGSGIIEGTVVSLTLGEVCPYLEEECPIDPYPNDWGIVRVDRVLSETTLGGGESESIIEQPAQSEAEGETSISGSQGQELDSRSTNNISLSEGQEVTTQFVLTARPVIVRYVPGNEFGATDFSNNLEGGADDTIKHPAQPAEIVFKELAQDEGVYIFTTKIGEENEEIRTNLPGLKVGTRFQAGILFDGILYINEYEIIP